MDNFKNNSIVTVSTGYDAAATSIVLSGGEGLKLPTVPFNAEWYDSTTYSNPSLDPNVEIVRVTNIATDTLTVTRAQEGTAATTKNTGGSTYKMIAGLTALTLNSTTGTGNIVLAGSPTIVTPTIASLTNAQHTHQDAAGGGALSAVAIGSGIIPDARMPDLTGDVTTNEGAVATTISTGAVGLSKMADIATDSILGRATAGTGIPEVLTALPFAATGDVTRPVDSNVNTIADAAVTLAKMANLAEGTVIGRAAGAGTGVPTALTAVPFTVSVATGGTGLTAVPGATTQVLFNNAGAFGADAAFAYDPATDHLTLLHSPAANTVPTVGLELANTEAASAGNQEYSPIFWLSGQGWKTTATAASQQVRFGFYVQTVQGSSAPTGRLKIVQQIAGGAVTEVGEITSAGSYTATATLNGASVVSSGNVQAGSSSQFAWNGRSLIKSSANGAVEFVNSAGTAQSSAQAALPPQSAKTANYPVVALDSGKRFNNIGAAGTITFTLPAAVVGHHNWFDVEEVQTLNVTAAGSDTIRWQSTVSGAAGTIASNTEGASCHVYCEVAGQWKVEEADSSWTLLAARCGNATLVGGTVTVTNATVTAKTIIMLTRKTSGGTIGMAVNYTVSAGTSFTITSDNILDTSIYSWFLIESP